MLFFLLLVRSFNIRKQFLTSELSQLSIQAIFIIFIQTLFKILSKNMHISQWMHELEPSKATPKQHAFQIFTENFTVFIFKKYIYSFELLEFCSCCKYCLPRFSKNIMSIYGQLFNFSVQKMSPSRGAKKPAVVHFFEIVKICIFQN